MKKDEFIEWLQEIPGNPEVQIFDFDSGGWYPVTGATYNTETIQLYSDDIC